MPNAKGIFWDTEEPYQLLRGIFGRPSDNFSLKRFRLVAGSGQTIVELDYARTAAAAKSRVPPILSLSFPPGCGDYCQSGAAG